MHKMLVGLVVVFVAITGFFIGTQKPDSQAVFAQTTTPSKTNAGTVASAAYAKCIQNGGFVTTDRRGSSGFYNICNFSDDMTCELYALYEAQCPIGGVHTIGYNTKPQVFCALRGGTPQGKDNGQCKMPDGKTCSTSQVYKNFSC